jgi:hypothetical protein
MTHLGIADMVHYGTRSAQITEEHRLQRLRSERLANFADNIYLANHCKKMQVSIEIDVWDIKNPM